MDHFFQDEQIILNFLKYLPTKDEIEKLSKYDDAPLEDTDKLGEPEKLCLQMMKIDRLKERLESMLFKSTFWDRYNLLHKQMTSVYNASLALKDAKNFKEILHLVLLLGNFLNGNTYRGGAFGFKIASINKLIDTKGTSKSTTLMHFLVDAVEKNFPSLLTFTEELDESGLASKVSRTEINLEYQAIETELKKIETELNNYPLASIDDNDVDQFAPIMHRFYIDASAQFRRICMLFTKMDESYDSAVRFYGEDPKKIQPDEFFEIFARFAISWEKCSKDSKETRLKQERLDKQKKREQERRKRANSNAGSLKSKNEREEDSAILHSLLDKLKKDTLDVKVRRRGDRQRSRQRSTSVNTSQSYSLKNPDAISMQAKRLLHSIQGDNSSSLLVDTSSPRYDAIGNNLNTQRVPDLRRPASASVAIGSSFRPFFEQETMESPGTIVPSLNISSRLDNPRQNAGGLSMPKKSYSSQTISSNSLVTPTRAVRVRKVSSKRPIFDHSLRARGRRMSTR